MRKMLIFGVLALMLLSVSLSYAAAANATAANATAPKPCLQTCAYGCNTVTGTCNPPLAAACKVSTVCSGSNLVQTASNCKSTTSPCQYGCNAQTAACNSKPAATSSSKTIELTLDAATVDLDNSGSADDVVIARLPTKSFYIKGRDYDTVYIAAKPQTAPGPRGMGFKVGEVGFFNTTSNYENIAFGGISMGASVAPYALKTTPNPKSLVRIIEPTGGTFELQVCPDCASGTTPKFRNPAGSGPFLMFGSTKVAWRENNAVKSTQNFATSFGTSLKSADENRVALKLVSAPATVCGNKKCEADETCRTCPKDCGCATGQLCSKDVCIKPPAPPAPTCKPAKVCSGNSLVSIVGNCKNTTSVCQYGCASGACKPKPVQTCKPAKVCSGTRLVNIAANCKNTTSVCQYGCASGACKPKPAAAKPTTNKTVAKGLTGRLLGIFGW